MYRKPYEFAQKTAQKLKYLRKLHGYSQQELADKLYMKQTTYSAYERGCIVLNGTMARELANIYNVSVSYILDDEQTDIYITEDQYKELINIKDALERIISNIQTSHEAASKKLPDDTEFQHPKRYWKHK